MRSTILCVYKYLRQTLQNDAYFIFFISLFFYLGVFFFCQTNKTLIMATILLGLLFWKRYKKIDLVIFLIYLVGIAFPVGKIHEFELIPPGIIRSEYFPNGLIAQVVIGVDDLCIFLMTFLMIRDAYHKKFFLPFSWPNVYLSIFIFTGILSSLVMAKLPDLSFIWALQSMEFLVAVLFFINLSRKIKTTPLLLSFCAALLVFESIVAGGQFIRNGYLG
jgi:hypothetical protein